MPSFYSIRAVLQGQFWIQSATERGRFQRLMRNLVFSKACVLNMPQCCAICRRDGQGKPASDATGSWVIAFAGNSKLRDRIRDCLGMLHWNNWRRKVGIKFGFPLQATHAVATLRLSFGIFAPRRCPWGWLRISRTDAPLRRTGIGTILPRDHETKGGNPRPKGAQFENTGRVKTIARGRFSAGNAFRMVSISSRRYQTDIEPAAAIPPCRHFPIAAIFVA